MNPPFVPLPEGLTGSPRPSLLWVKVSAEGRTMDLRRLRPSNDSTVRARRARLRLDRHLASRPEGRRAGRGVDPDAVPTAAGRITLLPKIHPSAFIAPTAAVMGDVTLGEDSSIWYGAVLRGDMAPIVIGAQTNLQDGTIVHVDDDVPCIIGDRVGVGHRVILHGCIVEDECLIGMGSILLNKVRIGTGSIVGGGRGAAGEHGSAAGLAGARRAGAGRSGRWTSGWRGGSKGPGPTTSSRPGRTSQENILLLRRAEREGLLLPHVTLSVAKRRSHSQGLADR